MKTFRVFIKLSKCQAALINKLELEPERLIIPRSLKLDSFSALHQSAYVNPSSEIFVTARPMLNRILKENYFYENP